MKTHNDEQETKTTERPAVSGCGENHACDKAKAEDFEITEEMIDVAYKRMQLPRIRKAISRAQ